MFGGLTIVTKTSLRETKNSSSKLSMKRNFGAEFRGNTVDFSFLTFFFLNHKYDLASNEKLKLWSDGKIFILKYVNAKLLHSCPTLCDSMDSSPPDPSVHGILQARILEWAAMPSSRGSS